MKVADGRACPLRPPAGRLPCYRAQSLTAISAASSRSSPVWLKRTGTEIRPAVEVAEVSVDEASSSVELLVACKHLADRGATLGGACARA